LALLFRKIEVLRHLNLTKGVRIMPHLCYLDALPSTINREEPKYVIRKNIEDYWRNEEKTQLILTAMSSRVLLQLMNQE